MALHADPLLDTLPMPSVDPSDPDSSHVYYHSVHVVHDHCEFLQVQINDPKAQFQKIHALIVNFSFLTLHTHLPFTAVCYLISQCLVSCICPYLSYQPVTHACATELDHLLAQCVHEYFHFPFQFNSTLLFLPISQLGFGFPSVTHLNDTTAVSGLLCDLNHHVNTFRIMAHITLADWTCFLNTCHSSLEDITSHPFTHSLYVLPTASVIALNVLCHYRIAIHSTDQSFLFSGDAALHHLAHIFSSHPGTPSSLAITNLE